MPATTIGSSIFVPVAGSSELYFMKTQGSILHFWPLRNCYIHTIRRDLNPWLEGLEPLTWGTWTLDLRGLNPWLEGLEPLIWGTWTLDRIGLEGLEPSILSIHTIRRDSNPRSCWFLPSVGTRTLNPVHSEHSYNKFLHPLLQSTHWHWRWRSSWHQ